MNPWEEPSTQFVNLILWLADLVKLDIENRDFFPWPYFEMFYNSIKLDINLWYSNFKLLSHNIEYKILHYFRSKQ